MKRTLYFFKWSILKSVLFLLITGLSCYSYSQNPELSIVTDKTPGVIVMHGLTKLTDVLQAKGITFEKVGSMNEVRGKWVIVTGLMYGDGTASQMLKAGSHAVPQVPEALTIWKTDWQKKPVWVISGFDDTGLMYGLLNVADRIGWITNRKSPMSEVKEITEQPDVKERAITMYTMNRTCWESRFYDEAYWTRYLDMLAEDRYNSMMVIFGYENGGFLAPCYPYFFDVEGFPDIRMVGLTPQEQERNLKALNRLIKMAHERGMRFSLGIWNHINRARVTRASGGVPFTGVQRYYAEIPLDTSLYVSGVSEENLIPYTQAALNKLVKVVPGLDGIQFRMHNESGLRADKMEAFWGDVFKAMKETAPKTLQFDLRVNALPVSIIQSAVNSGITFRLTTKYWMEQMGMPWHPTKINRENQKSAEAGYADLLVYPQQYQMQWTLWSAGTVRILLWGSPEYARRFAESTRLYSYGGGYEINEPVGTKMHGQPHEEKPFDLLNPQYVYYDYEFERYWHFFQVFGRMGYNFDQSPDIWQKEFELRFGKKAGPIIETALHRASWILPRIVAHPYPFRLSPTTIGWPEKMRLYDLPDYASAEGSDVEQFASFDKEAQILIEGGETAKVLPSMTSLWFEQTSSDINNLIVEAEKAIGKNRSKEFNSTITDLKILSNLALYHSRRIPAAVSYRIFVRTQDVSALDKAIASERNAIEAWRQIVSAAGDVYASNLKFGPDDKLLSGHWKDELRYLEQGLATLEQQRRNFKIEWTLNSAPLYKVALNADNGKLFQVSLQPVTSAPVGKPLTIKVKASASAGVKWVHLLYRSVNQKEDYLILQMTPAAEKDFYEATVPARAINPKYDFMYFIEVMDKYGNGKIYPDFNKEQPYIFVKLIR
jgi:hypothetical protein